MKIHKWILCTSYLDGNCYRTLNQNLAPNLLRFGSSYVVTAHTRVLHNNPHHQRLRAFCSPSAGFQGSMGRMRAAINCARAAKSYGGASSCACSSQGALHTELGMSHRTRAPCCPIVRSEVVNERLCFRQSHTLSGTPMPLSIAGGKSMRPSELIARCVVSGNGWPFVRTGSQ